MLMRSNKAETALHGCHCPDDMAVRMHKVLARPWVGVRVCHLFLLFLPFVKGIFHHSVWRRSVSFAQVTVIHCIQ